MRVAFSLFLLLVSGSLGMAEDERPVIPHSTWYRYVEDPSLRKFAPTSGLVIDADAWKKLTRAWVPADEIPVIDFSSELLVARTVLGHNRIRVDTTLKEGDLRVVTFATTDMKRPGFSFQFMKFKREGIKTVDGNPLETKGMWKPKGVSVSIVLPKPNLDMKDNVLEAKLWEYDPRLPDETATVIDEVSEASFGTEFLFQKVAHPTETTFSLGCRFKPREDRGYYLTVFVLKDGKRTHVAESTDKRATCHVLTMGEPKSAKFVLKPVP